MSIIEHTEKTFMTQLFLLKYNFSMITSHNHHWVLTISEVCNKKSHFSFTHTHQHTHQHTHTLLLFLSNDWIVKSYHLPPQHTNFTIYYFVPMSKAKTDTNAIFRHKYSIGTKMSFLKIWDLIAIQILVIENLSQQRLLKIFSM